METVRQFKRGTLKLDAILTTSYYLCDDAVFGHVLPNLVHCTVDWRKRRPVPHKSGPFFDVNDPPFVIYFIHWNNQRQSSSFDIEIIESK